MQSEERTPTPPTEISGEPPAVLVVDDDPAIRRTFQAGLARMGFCPSTVECGRRALQLLMRQDFDVLIVDIRMDEMDGIVFLQEALKIWPWLGVIIASGFVTPENERKALELGVHRILPKPISLQDLARHVAEEAQAKRTRTRDVPQDNALNLMRHHLNLLAQLSERALASETLLEALAEFGQALARMLPASAVGIMMLQGDQPILLLTGHLPLHQSFLDSVKDEMLTRFEILSGEPVKANDLSIRVEGPTGDAEATAPASTISVPIILDHDISGLLTLASAEPEAYSPGDTSLLYHSANHISAVFMTLKRMHRLASMDHLTGVYNRIRLEDELEHAWLLGRRYGYAMAVVVVDIDHFKDLNDAYGHAVGDDILKDFTTVLQGVARATDIIARYGGDEFVAILPRASETDAHTFGQRLLMGVHEKVFCERSYRLHLTISVGVATSDNAAAPATSAALLSQADRALYTAKRNGRNRLCMWPQTTGDADTPPSEAPSPKAADIKPVTPPRREVSAGPHDQVLVVDDEPQVLKLVTRLLERGGYTVTCVATAPEALEKVRSQLGYYDLLITDLNLPKVSGIELLHLIGDADASVVKIVMTGNATVDNAIDSLREGAYDFIQKPISAEKLAALVTRALEYRSLRMQNERYQSHLEDMVQRRSSQLAQSLEDVKSAYDFTLEALVAMLDAREHQTGKHSIRVRDLAVILAKDIGINGDELLTIASGAMLHDIGKIGMPDALLFRAGPLSSEEWHQMRRHPAIGYRILKASPYLQDAAEIVRSHHEHYDGSGYPRSLRGPDICLGARIFALVDSYDAMRSGRVYRAAISPEQAADEIEHYSGRQFDPNVVQAFMHCQGRLEEYLAHAPTHVDPALPDLSS